MKTQSQQAQVASALKGFASKLGLKARATSDSFAGGDSVDLHVLNATLAQRAAIESECEAYQRGRFDGMQDVYIGRKCDRAFSSKYVKSHFEYTDEVKQAVYAYAVEHVASDEEQAKLPTLYVDAANGCQTMGGERQYVSSVVYQLLTGARKVWLNHEQVPIFEALPDLLGKAAPAVEAVAPVQAAAPAVYAYHTESEVVKAALQIMETRARRTVEFTALDFTRDYFAAHLDGREAEVFSVAFLDNQHKLISCDDLFFGTIDGASVYPREVVKAALKHNAAAVIFAHNHPSGDATPSPADRGITKRLQAALELVDVRVLDHIVVGVNECTSFAARGFL